METGSWESWGGASKRAWMVMRVLEPAGWSFTVEVEEVLLEEAETLETTEETVVRSTGGSVG